MLVARRRHGHQVDGGGVGDGQVSRGALRPVSGRCVDGISHRDAKTGKYVPHAAMHKERLRRQELEAENAKIREEWARGEERLKLLTENPGNKALPAQGFALLGLPLVSRHSASIWPVPGALVDR